jgi:hypothetical protein
MLLWRMRNTGAPAKSGVTSEVVRAGLRCICLIAFQSMFQAS